MDDNITAISFVALGTSVPDRIVGLGFWALSQIGKWKVEAIQKGLHP